VHRADTPGSGSLPVGEFTCPYSVIRLTLKVSRALAGRAFRHIPIKRGG
jgi:hypothetical protein